MADEFVDIPIEDLKELFECAAKYLRHIAGSQNSEDLLYCYARYKQATEGECNTKKPGLFDFQGKQKWEAWQKLGSMSKKTAMMEYVGYLSKLSPGWEAEISEIDDKKPVNGSSWVCVSTMSNTDPEIDSQNKTVFDWCKEGNVKQVSKLVQKSDINSLDDAGMALLHWACDRGLKEMVECLLDNDADINIKDEDKQTPLHYAVSCEHTSIVQVLLSRGADITCTDNDGLTPTDIETSEEIKTMLNAGKT